MITNWYSDFPMTIIWYSKCQNTLGSEFIAMKTAINQIKALHYKLQMMGLPLDGEMDLF